MSALVEFMRSDLDAGDLPTGIERLITALHDRYDNAIHAVVLYGSCRRKTNASDGLVDLLVVVDSYRKAFGTGLLAGLNWLLPPNVFYLETREESAVLRCKYAVISLDQFQRRCASRSDHYFWARFCQPARLAYERGRAGDRLALARALAAHNFAKRVTPLIDQPMTPAAFWVRALTLTYRCELRPEPVGNAEQLILSDPDYWPDLTTALSGEPGRPVRMQSNQVNGSDAPVKRLATRLSWQARRITGKLFNLARLFKAAGTFTNGIDYIVWKVERHSGVRVEPTERMRRYPRLAAWKLAWIMWRKGGFK